MWDKEGKVRFILVTHISPHDPAGRGKYESRYTDDRYYVILGEKDPKHVPGEGKVSPLQKRTTRRFADKPIIQGAKSPIAAASTALLCLSGLHRAALHLPYLEASRCSKRVIESAPDSLPLSHTLLRHLAIPDIHAF